MTEEELIKRTKELKEQGRLKQVQHRKCENGDIKGLRKIIRDNLEISCIEIVAINPSWLDFVGCDEYFYTSDDADFNKEARKQILEI